MSDPVVVFPAVSVEPDFEPQENSPKMRQTSVVAFEIIRDEGLLSRMRYAVYEALFASGPMTGAEVDDLLKGSHGGRGHYHKRLSELKRVGVVEEVGKRPCRITGRPALIWDVTANIPRRRMREATYTILPAVRKDLEDKVASGQALLKTLESGTIDNADDEATAAKLLKIAHVELKTLDETRLQAGRPAREAQKDINALFQPAITVWTKAKIRAKALLDTAAEERAKANRKALEEAARTQSPEALAKVVPEAPPPGAAYRPQTALELVDEAKIPREYLTPDWPKIQAAWAKGVEVPGTRTVVTSKTVVGRG